MSWSICIKTVGNGDQSSSSTSSTSPLLPSSSNTSNTSNIESQNNNDNNNFTTTTKTTASSASNKTTPTNFTVHVEPDDLLSSLHQQIEDITGLKTCQQRLIYRGRLISGLQTQQNQHSTNAASSNANAPSSSTSTPSSSNHPNPTNNNQDVGNDESSPKFSESRIRDVAGLSDGQTIHLVPRPISDSTTPTTNNTPSNTASSSSSRTTTGSNSVSLSGNSGGASLLAAILGLTNSESLSSSSPNDDDDDEEDTTSNNNLTTTGSVGVAMVEGNDLLDSLFSISRPQQQQNRRLGGISTSNIRRQGTLNSHRRLASNPLYPDPCPLEPIRQGLLTLDTMLNLSNTTTMNTSQSSFSHDGNVNQQQPILPFHTPRKWYKGQWLDCRDTVNQWLEATIIDIILPHEILHSISDNKTTSSTTPHHNHYPSTPAIDPAIGANDYEGRRKLLLEPSDDEQDDTLSSYNNSDPSLIGYKERSYNQNVQLLLVHYNGWPHRWDEWIRSDSERIRPFRTRSRHIMSSSSGMREFMMSPSPNTAFHASPSTEITLDVSERDSEGGGSSGEVDENMERLALLPELYRYMGAIQDLFSEAILVPSSTSLDKSYHKSGSNSRSSHAKKSPNDDDADDLVMEDVELTLEEQAALSVFSPEKRARLLTALGCSNNKTSYCDENDEMKPKLKHTSPSSDEPSNTRNAILPWKYASHHHNQSNNKRKKSDDDTDNHEAEKCDDDDTENEDNLKNTITTATTTTTKKKMNKRKLEALAPLLDRLGRVLIDVAPHVAASAENLPLDSSFIADTLGEDDTEMTSDDPVAAKPSTSVAAASTTALPPVDPDHEDFVNGFINVSRVNGTIPRRNRSRNYDLRNNRDDNSLESSLRAVLGGGAGGGSSTTRNGSNTGDSNTSRQGGPTRVVRMVGGNGEGNSGGGLGIDILIHATVTGPGGLTSIPGLDGLAGLMGSTTNLNPSNTMPTNSSSVPENAAMMNASIANADVDEDDMGIFSDLYSDNPDPSTTTRRTESQGEEATNTIGSNDITNTTNPEYPVDDNTAEIDDVSLPRFFDAIATSHTGLNPSSPPRNDASTAMETNSVRPSSQSSTASGGQRRSNILGRLFRRSANRNSSSNNSP